MLDLRLCATLALAPCLLAIGCSSGGGTGGAGTGTGTGTTTASGSSTHSASSSTTGASTSASTTATGTGSTTSTGSGGSCMLHTTPCGQCALTGACQTQATACGNDAGCKAATAPGGTLDTCLCNAEMMGGSTAQCFTSFDAMGAVDKAFGDCVTSMCKTQCGL